MIFERRGANSDPADGTLVLFHGRGTDEHDLQPIVDALDPEGRLVGLTPRAPFTMPPGGFHWYGPVVRVGYPNAETFFDSFAQLSQWLEEEVPDIGRAVLAASRRARSWPTRSGSAPGARRRPGSWP